MLNQSRAERVKRERRIEDVIRSYGVELVPAGSNGQLKGLCPFHKDKNPSLSVNPAKGVWNCFAGCGAGSLIDWTAKIKKISYKEAIDFLDRFRPGSVQEKCQENKYSPEQISLIRHKKNNFFPLSNSAISLLNSICDYYHKTLRTNNRALGYLKKRRIDDPEIIRRFRLGYADGSIIKLLPKESEERKDALGLGLLNNNLADSRKDKEIFCDSLIVPIFESKTGQSCVGLYGRKLREVSTRHLYLKGPHRGVFNPQAFSHQEIILCESIIDALTLLNQGYPNVTACYGVNGWTPVHEQLFKESRIKQVYLAFDMDEAGERGALAAAERLKGLGIETIDLKLSVNNGQYAKDVNDYFVKHGKSREDWERLMKKGQRSRGKRQGEQLLNPGQTSSEQKKDLLTSNHRALSSDSDGCYYFTYAQRQYRVMGLSPYNLERMKVTLRVKGQGSRIRQRLLIRKIFPYSLLPTPHSLSTLIPLTCIMPDPVYILLRRLPRYSR